MQKGSCLIAYVPLRAEPRSGAEMVSTLLFGESYSILEDNGEWLKILTDFDGYEAWMSKGSHSDSVDFNEVNDALFLEAVADNQKMFIPCGAMIPESGSFFIGKTKFKINRKLKTNHHLPLKIRLLKTAQYFLNTPYLWGGRSFMGIDCSGFVQVVFKANGIDLPRDTSQQMNVGTEVGFDEIKAGDIILFSKPDSDKVSHVGIYFENGQVIHSSSFVQFSDFTDKGLMIEGKLAYKLICIRRVI